jgi:hypothetical protein
MLAWYVVRPWAFNVPNSHPLAFLARDSNTHRHWFTSLCMWLFLVSERSLRGIYVYQAAKGVIDDYDGLVDLFESTEHFLNRLEIYTKVPPTVIMTEITVRILVELLSTLALTTKQIKQGKTSKSVFGEVLCYLNRCALQRNLLRSFLGTTTSKRYSKG